MERKARAFLCRDMTDNRPCPLLGSAVIVTARQCGVAMALGPGRRGLMYWLYCSLAQAGSQGQLSSPLMAPDFSFIK